MADARNGTANGDDVEMAPSGAGDRGRRTKEGGLFGAAVGAVRQQPKATGGVSSQVRALNAGGNVFDRMDTEGSGGGRKTREVFMSGPVRPARARRVIGPYSAPRAVFSSPRERDRDRDRSGGMDLDIGVGVGGSSSDKWDHDLYFESAGGGGRGIEATSHVFVRNLPKETTKDMVIDAFAKVGEVVFVKLDSGPIVTAMVGFLRKGDAEEAASRLNKTTFKARGRRGVITSEIKVAVVDQSAQPGSRHNKDDEDLGPRGGDLREQLSVRGPSFLPSDRPRQSVFARMK
ncbi:unnamed protein product [Vitrella brassicaformis CCMP3155]|uniref:RRM domain-containing protein n=2 Tax=Vitrella brassicaformis TaxID=1169539 RepID=A0A0G4EUC4_VITBC|nr:unnamed protein product [Vitrella brassicaformis CCMP3155]|eukprot:CEM01805.1 unnamed protein product [Vitrella brassicaformis CCMP3155]